MPALPRISLGTVLLLPSVILLMLFENPYHIYISSGLAFVALILLIKTPVSFKAFDVSPRQLLVVLLLFATIPGLTSLIEIYTRGGFDISWYSNVVYNISHFGDTFVALGVPMFHIGQHFDPILYLIAPLSKLFAPVVPVYAQLMLLSVSVAVLAIGLLRARSKGQGFSGDALLLICLSVVAHWGITAAQRFEFHAVTLGAYLSLAALILATKGRTLFAIIFLIFSLGCGEVFLFQFPILVVVVALLAREVRWRHFVFLGMAFVVGFAALYFYAAKLGPIWSASDQHVLLGRYAALGGSIDEMLKNILTKPLFILSLVFELRKVEYLFYLALFVVPTFVVYFLVRNQLPKEPNRHTAFVLFCLIAGFLCFAGSLGKILLSDASTYTIRRHHYAAEMVPSFFLICLGIQKYLKLDGFSWGMLPRGKVTLALLFSFAVLQLPQPNRAATAVADYFRSDQLFPGRLRDALNSVPKDLAVFVNNLTFSTALSQRRTLFTPMTPVSAMGAPDVIVSGWPPGHLYDSTKTAIDNNLKEIGPNMYQVSIANNRTIYELAQVVETGAAGSCYIFKKVPEFVE